MTPAGMAPSSSKAQGLHPHCDTVARETPSPTTHSFPALPSSSPLPSGRRLRSARSQSTTISHELNAHFSQIRSLQDATGSLHVCRERAGVSLKCTDFGVAKHIACILREDTTARAFSFALEGVALASVLTQRNLSRPDEDAVVVKVRRLNTPPRPTSRDVPLPDIPTEKTSLSIVCVFDPSSPQPTLPLVV